MMVWWNCLLKINETRPRNTAYDKTDAIHD